MTKIEYTLRELSDLWSFYQKTAGLRKSVQSQTRKPTQKAKMIKNSDTSRRTDNSSEKPLR